MDKVRIGIVGCGEVAVRHVNALKKIKQADLIAVADIDEERARRFARNFEVQKCYDSLKSMLANEQIDGVLILTNPQSHCQLAIEAMKHGKHVLVEKPLCVTLKEAEEMMKSCRKNSVILFPAEQFLFTPAIQKSIKLISSGRLGKVISIYTYMSISPLVERLKKGELPRWMYTLPGGIYGEEISHCLYTTLKILNEVIDEVYVSCIERSGQNALPCTELRILLEGKSRSARIIMTARGKSRHTLLTLVINCEKGAIIVDPPLSLSLVRTYIPSRFIQATSFTKNFLDNIFGNIKAVIAKKIYEGCSWESINRAFIECITKNQEPPITIEEAKEWTRIVEFVWKKLSFI